MSDEVGVGEVVVVGGDLLADALRLANRLAAEVAQREAVLGEVAETAYGAGATVRDLEVATGIPKSTWQRRLARPIPAFAGKVEGDLGHELDALRRRRLAYARAQADERQAEVDALPAMQAEYEEALALTRLDSDLARHR